MNDSQILAVYMAQSENVRHLKQIINASRQDINLDIRKGNDFQVKAKTKIMALIYSAWSEAQFLQIAYTEKGFSSAEINILIQAKKDGVTKGWNKMINLAFLKVGDPSTDPVLNSRLNHLLLLVKNQIEKPSLLRNKIAHGQWVKALNAASNKVNSDLTNQLDGLDAVQIFRQVEMHQYLGSIVRDLVQSPGRGFGRDYARHIADLDSYAVRTQNWSVQDKRKELLRKPIKS